MNRTTFAAPTATGTHLRIRTTTSGFALCFRVLFRVRIGARDCVERTGEESRPVPAMAATPSEYHATAGGLVGASRTLVCVFCLFALRMDGEKSKRFVPPTSSSAGHPASIRVPVRFPANKLAGYSRASLTGRESFIARSTQSKERERRR